MSEGKFCEIGAIVKDGVKWEDDATEEINKIRVRDKIETSVSLGLADNSDVPTFIGADYNNGETYCSVSIMGETIINKPENLKYPNKKRARRIWKKWKRRFGCRPTSALLFPKARVDVDLSTDMGVVRITGVANE